LVGKKRKYQRKEAPTMSEEDDSIDLRNLSPHESDLDLSDFSDGESTNNQLFKIEKKI
jgi:hypothetical protein